MSRRTLGIVNALALVAVVIGSRTSAAGRPQDRADVAALARVARNNQ